MTEIIQSRFFSFFFIPLNLSLGKLFLIHMSLTLRRATLWFSMSISGSLSPTGTHRQLTTTSSTSTLMMMMMMIRIQCKLHPH